MKKVIIVALVIAGTFLSYKAYDYVKVDKGKEAIQVASASNESYVMKKLVKGNFPPKFTHDVALSEVQPTGNIQFSLTTVAHGILVGTEISDITINSEWYYDAENNSVNCTNRELDKAPW